MLTLMDHQVQALQFLYRRDGIAGLFAAPGTGKTLIAERFAKYHLPALLILRRDDFLTWELHLLSELYGLDDYHQIKKGKSKLIQAPWTMITYDLFKNKAIFDFVVAHQWHIVVADESRKLKNYGAARTKRVIKATRHIPRRIAMDGSPITNSLLDIMSQMWFVDDGATFGKSKFWFQKRYFVQDPRGHGWIPKAKAKDQIAKKLSDVSFYIHEDDALTLPPVRKFVKGCEMNSAQKRHTKSLLEEWETDVRGFHLEYDHVVQQMNLLRQVAGGFLYDEEKQPQWFSLNKIKLLLKLLDDPDYFKHKKKIVVWCMFKAEIQKLHEMLEDAGIDSTVFYGGMRDRAKIDSRLRFRDDSDCRVFIGQGDCGVGMNELVVSDTALYYSNSTRVDSRLQNMRRNRRKGSEVHDIITYVDLCTEDSIDLKIYQALNDNIDIANYILDKIRQGYKFQDILRKEFTIQN